jgi:hypothetical protein
MKSKENQVSVQIKATDLEKAIIKLKEVKTILKPFLIALKAKERRGGIKMSDKSLPFVEKVVEYAQTHPNFKPPYMQLDELLIDLKAVGDLTQLYREVNQLCDNLNDTILLSGTEAFTESLAYYNSVKQAAKMNVPEAKVIYEDLKKRFERKAKN